MPMPVHLVATCPRIFKNSSGDYTLPRASTLTPAAADEAYSSHRQQGHGIPMYYAHHPRFSRRGRQHGRPLSATSIHASTNWSRFAKSLVKMSPMMDAVFQLIIMNLRFSHKWDRVFAQRASNHTFVPGQNTVWHFPKPCHTRKRRCRHAEKEATSVYGCLKTLPWPPTQPFGLNSLGKI